MKRTILSFLCLVSFCNAIELCGQGTQDDYHRMAGLRAQSVNQVFRVHVTPNWLPGGEYFWYRIQTGKNSFEFVFADLIAGTRKLAFDHASVAKQLSAQTEKEVDAGRLPFEQIEFSEDLQSVLFRYGEADWKIRRENSKLAKAGKDERPAKKSDDPMEVPRSRNVGERMEVKFVNETDGNIRLIWNDNRGRRVPYETIPAGQIHVQNTVEGHIWLILNSKNEALAIYEAKQSEKTLRVDGKTKIAIKRESFADRRRPSNRRRSNARPRASSPDERYRAFVKDHQLVVEDNQSSEQSVLTQYANADNFFGNREIYWSPDSRYLVAMQIKPAESRKIHMVESAPRGQVQPKLHTMDYVKPGDEIRTSIPHLFDLQEKVEIPLDSGLFENPWRLSDFRWKKDSSEFSFLFNQRGHQVMRVVGIDPQSKTTRAIIDESTETFVDYTKKVFSHYNENAGEIIWMSERDGWNHLYLYDWHSGKVKNQITRGEWVVRAVDLVDDAKRQIWFQASGVFQDQDPYQINFCRVDFDGSNLVVLTEGNGTHEIEYSPDRKYLIDRFSRVDMPMVTTVRRVQDGSLVCDLESGDWSALLQTGWKPPIPFSAKGRDDKTDIYGVIYLPTNFDDEKTYPVIEYIYAGPHDSFVPKKFSTHDQVREMAELGFIVVRIDGMGTSNRSKAFQDVCWKNLGDSGFPDRVKWIKAAAEKYPMDLRRVGIYGGSAGGQSALRGLLAFDDFYKVGVADCGCHDNRMDKIWWNEQWMGWPIGDHYAEQSNVTNAHKLQGKLFLIVGELDRNVDPASTMQVVDALIKANKDFDLLVVPGGGHGVGSRPYGMRRTRDFFVRHLYGVEPRR